MKTADSLDVDPARFACWLGHGVTADLIARMLAVPRLETRCGHLLRERLGPWPDASGAPPCPARASVRAAHVRDLDGLALLWLAQQAGAIWHARSILRVIDGVAVRALVSGIGATLRLVAIRHAALAPADADGTTGVEALPVDTLADPELLARRIAHDGIGCLAAWCDAQPPALGQRVLLGLPAPWLPTDAYRAYGPPILDVLLDDPA